MPTPKRKPVVKLIAKKKIPPKVMSPKLRAIQILTRHQIGEEIKLTGEDGRWKKTRHNPTKVRKIRQ